MVQNKENTLFLLVNSIPILLTCSFQAFLDPIPASLLDTLLFSQYPPHLLIFSVSYFVLSILMIFYFWIPSFSLFIDLGQSCPLSCFSLISASQLVFASWAFNTCP
ncbi:MAG: hypothetical protein J3R72DRAFT_23368 [Linnemannia gamsii]|nr:MAG: hypothetical protein J3R72DRAFT_23368 [Linnemannia gamsii]